MKYHFLLQNSHPLGLIPQLWSSPFQYWQYWHLRETLNKSKPLNNKLVLQLMLHASKKRELRRYELFFPLRACFDPILKKKETVLFQFFLIWSCSIIYFLQKPLKGWRPQGFCRCVELQCCTFLTFRSVCCYATKVFSQCIRINKMLFNCILATEEFLM